MGVGTTDVSAQGNPVAILLSYDTVRILLAGDAEAREEYVAGDPYTGSLIVVRV